MISKSKASLLAAAFFTAALTATAQTMSSPPTTPPQPATWPTQDGTYTIKNFHFNSGETLLN